MLEGFKHVCTAMPRLWKRKANGIYYVTWMERGKQLKRSLKTRDKRIAIRLFNNFKRDFIAGKVKLISQGIRQTLYPFVEEFLNHIKGIKEPSTYRLYSVALEKAKRSWGDIPLSHLTSRHIDTLITDMVRSGLKAPTVNKNCRHIKAALNKAREWEYIQNPIRFPKPVKEEEKVRYLTKKQLGRLISEIDDPEFADFCLFSAYTGLRSGEIVRLSWEDIDNPESGLIRISSRQKNKKEAWVPLNSHARAIIDRCRGRGGPKPFRFNSLTWVSQKFKKYARRAGLGHCRFHDMRHTYGSHLAMSGENEVAIQKLMRHRSMLSTLIYTNVSLEYLKKATEKVNYGPMPLPKKKR